MKGKMTVIAPNGTITTEELTAAPDLKSLQFSVGGLIQQVPYLDVYFGSDGTREPCVAFCNDEGKLNGMPFNRTATEAWARNAPAGAQLEDFLVGPVVIITGDAELLEAL